MALAIDKNTLTNVGIIVRYYSIQQSTYEYRPHHSHSNATRIAAARRHGLACLKACCTHFSYALVSTVTVAVYLVFNTRLRIRVNDMARRCSGYDKAEDINVREAQLQLPRYRSSSAVGHSNQDPRCTQKTYIPLFLHTILGPDYYAMAP